MQMDKDYQRPLDNDKVTKLTYIYSSTFPPRHRRTILNMVCSTFYPLYKKKVRRELVGAVERRNWIQARIWMGWFR